MITEYKPGIKKDLVKPLTVSSTYDTANGGVSVDFYYGPYGTPSHGYNFFTQLSGLTMNQYPTPVGNDGGSVTAQQIDDNLEFKDYDGTNVVIPRKGSYYKRTGNRPGATYTRYIVTETEGHVLGSDYGENECMLVYKNPLDYEKKLAEVYLNGARQMLPGKNVAFIDELGKPIDYTVVELNDGGIEYMDFVQSELVDVYTINFLRLGDADGSTSTQLHTKVNNPLYTAPRCELQAPKYSIRNGMSYITGDQVFAGWTPDPLYGSSIYNTHSQHVDGPLYGVNELIPLHEHTVIYDNEKVVNLYAVFVTPEPIEIDFQNGYYDANGNFKSIDTDEQEADLSGYVSIGLGVKPDNWANEYTSYFMVNTNAGGEFKYVRANHLEVIAKMSEIANGDETVYNNLLNEYLNDYTVGNTRGKYDWRRVKTDNPEVFSAPSPEDRSFDLNDDSTYYFVYMPTCYEGGVISDLPEPTQTQVKHARLVSRAWFVRVDNQAQMTHYIQNTNPVFNNNISYYRQIVVDSVSNYINGGFDSTYYDCLFNTKARSFSGYTVQLTSNLYPLYSSRYEFDRWEVYAFDSTWPNLGAGIAFNYSNLNPETTYLGFYTTINGVYRLVTSWDNGGHWTYTDALGTEHTYSGTVPQDKDVYTPYVTGLNQPISSTVLDATNVLTNGSDKYCDKYLMRAVYKERNVFAYVDLDVNNTWNIDHTERYEMGKVNITSKRNNRVGGDINYSRAIGYYDLDNSIVLYDGNNTQHTNDCVTIDPNNPHRLKIDTTIASSITFTSVPNNDGKTESAPDYVRFLKWKGEIETANNEVTIPLEPGAVYSMKAWFIRNDDANAYVVVQKGQTYTNMSNMSYRGSTIKIYDVAYEQTTINSTSGEAGTRTVNTTAGTRTYKNGMDDYLPYAGKHTTSTSETRHAAETEAMYEYLGGHSNTTIGSVQLKRADTPVTGNRFMIDVSEGTGYCFVVASAPVNTVTGVETGLPFHNWEDGAANTENTGSATSGVINTVSGVIEYERLVSVDVPGTFIYKAMFDNSPQPVGSSVTDIAFNDDEYNNGSGSGSGSGTTETTSGSRTLIGGGSRFANNVFDGDNAFNTAATYAPAQVNVQVPMTNATTGEIVMVVNTVTGVSNAQMTTVHHYTRNASQVANTFAQSAGGTFNGTATETVVDEVANTASQTQSQFTLRGTTVTQGVVDAAPVNF